MDLLDLKAEDSIVNKITDIPFEMTRIDNAYLIPHLGSKEWDGHIYVSGATGSGKSYLIKQIVLNDLKKRDIVIFSDLDSDNSFKELYESGRAMTPEEASEVAAEKKEENTLENKLVIFDDCTKQEHIDLRDHLLEKGRHTNTVVICVNHKLRDWMATRKPLNESRYIVMFPSAGKVVVSDFLDRLKLDRKTIKKIVDLANQDGRYLIFHQFNPNALITQRTILSI